MDCHWRVLWPLVKVYMHAFPVCLWARIGLCKQPLNTSVTFLLHITTLLTIILQGGVFIHTNTCSPARVQHAYNDTTQSYITQLTQWWTHHSCKSGSPLTQFSVCIVKHSGVPLSALGFSQINNLIWLSRTLVSWENNFANWIRWKSHSSSSSFCNLATKLSQNNLPFSLSQYCSRSRTPAHSLTILFSDWFIFLYWHCTYSCQSSYTIIYF